MADKLTYRELMQTLIEMAEGGDARLDDFVLVDCDGEFYPAELLEYEGDEVLDDGRLVMKTNDWINEDAENVYCEC